MTEIIKFHDAELIGERDDETIWIACKPISDAIGVYWGSQLEAIKRDPILGRAYGTRHMHDASGRKQEMGCLPLHHIHGWLFKIPVNLVKEGVRPTLIIYQEECYQVLYEHFLGNGRQLRIDAEREQVLILEKRKYNKIIRDAHSILEGLEFERQVILNRRAKAYHLNEPYPEAEIKLAKANAKLDGPSIPIDFDETPPILKSAKRE